MELSMCTKFSPAKSMGNSSSFFNDIGQDVINKIVLIESSIRWQCIQGGQTHTAESNHQHNLLSPYHGFFS
jgi:hypothetical protein